METCCVSFDAKKRGIILTLVMAAGVCIQPGHTAIKHGFLPDSISTDLHIGSMNAGMKT